MKTRESQEDLLIAFSLVSSIAVAGIGTLLETILSLAGAQGHANATLGSWLLILPALILAIPTVFRRTPLRFVLTTIACAVLFALWGLLHWQNAEYYLLLGLSILPAFCMLYFAGAVTRFDLVLKFLQVAAGLIVIGVLGKIVLQGSEVVGDYSQTLAFVTLPAAVILVDLAFASPRPHTIAIGFISIALLFAMGARGPVVCLLLYISLRILLVLSGDLKRLLILGPLILSAGVAISVSAKSLLSTFSKILQSLGFSTRATDLLGEGKIFKDDAREQLANYALDSIRQNPQFGIGPGQDRLYLMHSMGFGTTQREALGSYPHNIVLELVMQFGVLFGPLILLGIVGLVTFAILRGTSIQSRILMIYVGIGLLPLLFSRSYLQFTEFYILVGLSLAVLRTKGERV